MSEKVKKKKKKKKKKWHRSRRMSTDSVRSNSVTTEHVGRESPGSVEDEYIDEHQSSEPLIANCLSNDVATINLAPKVASHRRRHDQPKTKQNQTLTLPTCQPIKNQVLEDRTPNQTQSAYRTCNQSESVLGSASVNQSVDNESRAVKRHKRGKSTLSRKHKMTKSTYRSTNQTGSVSTNQSEDSEFRISKKQTRRTFDGDHIHTLKNMKIEPHLRKDLEYEDSMNK